MVNRKGTFDAESGKAASARAAIVRQSDHARITANEQRRMMITQHLISELNAVDPYTNVTKARLMVLRLVTLATSEIPDMAAIKEIYDRVEGKSRQPVDVTHDGAIAVRSAAVSLLAELVDEATGRNTGQSGEDPLPN